MASIVDRHATETGKQGGKRWQVRWRDDRNVQRRKAFAKKAEADSIMKSHVVDRTRGHPIETFGAQARPPRLALPRLYNQKQHFRRFPRGRCGRSLARLERSSPRDPVAWVHEGLDDIQHETHCHQHRPQRSPGAPQGVICALRP